MKPPPQTTPRVAPLITKQFNSALVAFRSGDLDRAERALQMILEQSRRHFDTLYLLGIVKAQRQQYGAALRLLDEAVVLRPDIQEAQQNRRIILAQCSEARIREAVVLHQQGRFDEAGAIYQEVLQRDPDNLDAIQLSGTLAAQKGDYARALEFFQRVLAIRPDFAEVHCNRGNALKELKRLDEALASYDRAIAIKPGHADAYNNRGLVLHELKRFDEALASYDRAIAIRPDYADAHRNQALSRLLVGDFAKGWGQYEWRWQSEKGNASPRHGNRPLWLGAEDLAGKTILLWSEQGLGDTLQFCRYARLVADLGATVYLEVQRSLKALLNDLDGVAAVFGEGDTLPKFDFQCPLLSLPLAFRSTEASISGAPYIRAPAPRPWMTASLRGTRPRIGVAWSGNIGHSNDHNRSLPFSRFQSLLPPGIEVVCLQKDIRDADRVALGMHPEIQTVDSLLNDFTDTAALMHELDLVVAVDTSIAHLAGATGKEVWLLLPWIPDWRWLLDRTDSPWYDSMTLFRQPAIGDWDSVLAEVRQKLIERFGAR